MEPPNIRPACFSYLLYRPGRCRTHGICYIALGCCSCCCDITIWVHHTLYAYRCQDQRGFVGYTKQRCLPHRKNTSRFILRQSKRGDERRTRIFRTLASLSILGTSIHLDNSRTLASFAAPCPALPYTYRNASTPKHLQSLRIFLWKRAFNSLG